jgi:peptidoglycan/LPS O-acetylase OafA/YrhL
VLLLYVVRCGLLDGVLQSRVAQFMGRISYGFYLVHLPILLSFSAWFYVVIRRTLALDTIPAALLTIPVTFAVVIAAAVVFDRTFDRWGIALSQTIFPAPRERPKTVAARSIDGLRRRLRYRRRRIVGRGDDGEKREFRG